MREMKFKAWSPKENKFILSNQIGKQDIPTRATRQGFALKTNFILLQYTGLKDKTGKEIYEGDIVKHEYDHLGLRKEKLHEIEIGHIVYCKDNIAFQVKGFNSYDCFWMKKHGDLEVIGNIYENSELLKEEPKCKKL